jgi:poly-gamma-glutamate synthesis protein (capsule biosynthesis protein)
MFRDDLGLLYFPTFDTRSGNLVSLTMSPTRILRMQLRRPSCDEIAWLRAVLNREGEGLGTRVELNEEPPLELRW